MYTARVKSKTAKIFSIKKKDFLTNFPRDSKEILIN